MKEIRKLNKGIITSARDLNSSITEDNREDAVLGLAGLVKQVAEYKTISKLSGESSSRRPIAYANNAIKRAQQYLSLSSGNYRD